jgi:membrane-bound lytic murein transglycosylase F
MKKFLKKSVTITILIVILLSVSFNLGNKNPGNNGPEINDLPQIRGKGKMVVITDFNSINYFIYHGQPMGFQYELLQELADYMNLELEVKVNNDLQENFESLINGNVDLIASNLTITKSKQEKVAFTVSHSQTSQVLVQRKSISLNPLSGAKNQLIRNQIDFAGKTIHVLKGSSYAIRLRSLSEEIGEEIKIVEAPAETEQLIKMVANGEINYTVADENIARVNKLYYPDLDIETTISHPQNVAWAVRKDAVLLRNEIDNWLTSFKKTNTYAHLYNKYFKSPGSASIVNSEYYYPSTGRLSKYDQILKKESEKIGWDWRLLSSMIYQESGFNDQAVSRRGAFGIMQLMPAIASNYGVNRESSPAENIRAGVRLIKWLDERFENKVTDKNERIRFVLAAYNIGYGHVTDAMRLAQKNGKNPGIWENNVEIFLLKKSQPQYYNDPVVRSGYCKGKQTCAYVRQIMYRYDHYLNLGASMLSEKI